MAVDLFQLGVKAVVQDEQGRILLLQISKPVVIHGSPVAYWDLPGGRVEVGQTVEQTLRREIEEEVGLHIAGELEPLVWSVANVRLPYDGTNTGWILIAYKCQLPPGASIRLSDEHSDYGWFTPQEAAEKLAVKYPEEFTSKIKELA